MDSYIIRIYRRGTASGKEIAGLVERIGSDARQAFGTRDELWSFLIQAPKNTGIPDRKRRSPRT